MQLPVAGIRPGKESPLGIVDRIPCAVNAVLVHDQAAQYVHADAAGAGAVWPRIAGVVDKYDVRERACMQAT